MKRVVITGMGIVAPNGKNIRDFQNALVQGNSGIQFQNHLEDIGMRCCVAGIPEYEDEPLKSLVGAKTVMHLTGLNVKYACIAAIEAWQDAGLSIEKQSDNDAGCIIGFSIGDISLVRQVIQRVDQKSIPKLGTRYVEQLMGSGASAKIAGLLGLGNRVFGNSSACATGSESVLLAFEHIQQGKAKRMVAGSCEAPDPYIWANFDNMRLLTRKGNAIPEEASRPLSESASGFVPGAGAGILVLEEFEAAHRRGARIYGEIIAGSSNSGGQRNGGSMTFPNKNRIISCIQNVLKEAAIKPQEVDLISGHLTATRADSMEILCWSQALGLSGKDFPKINTLKSLIGHCLSAAGSIEIIGLLLQMYHDFVHPNLNCRDVNTTVAALIHPDCIPHETEFIESKISLKANFGFGDVNTVLAFRKC